MADPESFPLVSFLSVIGGFSFNDGMYLGGLLLLALLFLFASAVISASEIAFFSIDQSELNKIELEHPKRGKIIASLLDRPKRLLATILITNNAVNISLVVISTLVVEYFQQFGGSPAIYLFIQIVVVTTLLLLFGEIVPKVFATQRFRQMVLFSAQTVYVLNYALSWFSSSLVGLTKIFDRIFKEEKKNISVDELSKVHEMIQDYHHNEQEQKMLDGILELGNSDVRSIMQPRTEVTTLNKTDTFSKVREEILDSGYSRIPVVGDSIDQVIGILYIKDLLPHLEESEDFNWVELVRAPFFFPEHKKLDDALKEFQEQKIHLAIVVDEYGGNLGIVTLEDVIEEIVGDIKNEFDDDEIEYSRIGPNRYSFDAKTLLKDMIRVADLNADVLDKFKGDSETIAGFILEQTGEFPKKKDVIEIGDYAFTVEAIDRKRIKRVKLEVKENED